MAILYFFGDSWTSEKCEVEELFQQGRYTPYQTIQSIPAIVSTITGVRYRNLSVSGSSQEHMLYRLFESDISPGDHAIFALSAPSRRFYLDDDSNPKSVQHDFVSAINDHTDSWKSANVVNMFYQECIYRKVIPWFYNLFNRSRFDSNKILENRWNQVPRDRWLINPSSCAVAEWLDPGWFSRYEKYMNSDFYDWLKSGSTVVNDLISPCQEHPNMEGRWLIAKKIAEKIL